MVHFEIPYDDADRARAFYAGAFAWDLDPMAGHDYTVAVTGPVSDGRPSEAGFVNGGLAPRGPALSRPTVVVDVEDIESTLTRVLELGGAVLLERTAVGEMGFSAYLTDSEGNVLALWQSA